MSELRRRGRRPNVANPKTAAADRAIALTVYQLSTWGLPLRTSNKQVGVYEIVGLRAKCILERYDHDKKPLGPDRIEQIFEAWFSVENFSRRKEMRWPLLRRSRYLKDSLRGTVPPEARRLSTDERVDVLLRNGGRSPWKPALYTGDLILAPKEEEKKGVLTDFAVDGVVQRMMRLWIEKHGPVTPAKADMLQQVFVRCLGLAYRADILGDAPDSLKNRVEK